MGELIEDLMRTKVPPPAYCRIQKFLTKVCVTFSCFSIHSYNWTLVYSLIFFGFLLCRLEQAVHVQIPSLRFTHGLIYSLQMCPRTYMCRASRPRPHTFFSETSDLTHILRSCLPSQMPTFMTTTFLSLHTPLILMCLDQFTTEHTLRNSTLPKIGLAWMTSISNRPLLLPSW